MWDRQQASAYAAHDAVKAFDKLGVVLPADVVAAVAVLDRIEAEVPAPPSATAIREAILDNADADRINALIVAALGQGLLGSEYAQAVIIAGRGVLRAILNNRDELHAALRVLAEHHIKQLVAVAALDGASLDTLVRAGRVDDARLLADTDVIGAQLVELYDLRDRVLFPGGLQDAVAGDWDCTRFTDPSLVGHYWRNDLNLVHNYVHLLRQGVELHYPTAEEALAMAAPMYEAAQRDARRIAAEQRQGGGLAAFA